LIESTPLGEQNRPRLGLSRMEEEEADTPLLSPEEDDKLEDVDALTGDGRTGNNGKFKLAVLLVSSDLLSSRG